MSAAASRALSVPKIRTDSATTKVLKDNGVDPKRLIEKTENGSYKSVDDLLKELKKEVKDLEDPS